ncbi:cuticle protein 19-like [Macrobrachium nipponense]|uniref:cuticle protein 19-like n=1 Tax=Macrobrachium nipponense TaxID=159736 RepID=UPI0030C7D8E9
MPFDFEFAVNDQYKGLDFAHDSESDGNVVKGEYHVLLPDGRTQIVTYTADAYNGYQAEVTYEGEAQYPEPQPYTPAPAYSAPAPAYSAPAPAPQTIPPPTFLLSPSPPTFLLSPSPYLSAARLSLRSSQKLRSWQQVSTSMQIIIYVSKKIYKLYSTRVYHYTSFINLNA